MRLLFYWICFFASAFQMHKFYGGKVPLETCICVTLLVLVAVWFMWHNFIRAATWFMANFYK